MTFVVRRDGIVTNYISLTLQNGAAPYPCVTSDYFVRSGTVSGTILVPAPVEREKIMDTVFADVYLHPPQCTWSSSNILEIRFASKGYVHDVHLLIDNMTVLETIVAAANGVAGAPWLYHDYCDATIFDERVSEEKRNKCLVALRDVLYGVKLGDVVRGLGKLVASGGELSVYAAYALLHVSNIGFIEPRRRKYGFIPLIGSCLDYRLLRILDVIHGDWRGRIRDLFHLKTDICDHVEVEEYQDGRVHLQCWLGRLPLGHSPASVRIIVVTEKKPSRKRIDNYISEIEALLG